MTANIIADCSHYTFSSYSYTTASSIIGTWVAYNLESGHMFLQTRTYSISLVLGKYLAHLGHK